MQLYDKQQYRSALNRQSAFTMVEIALSIAVVAFAMVAILGVLPTGMTVQKDNRDDNIINQEGRYWIEAIRNGARGLEDITNYVESITLSNRTKNVTFDLVGSGGGYKGTPLQPVDIIALLSTQKYFGNETNRITARVKAITGPASEKGPLTNEFSFRYEMQVEITPARALPYDYIASLTGTDQTTAILYNETLARTLHDVRIVLRWPVVQRGNGWFVGGNRKTFRSRIAGAFTTETNVTAAVSDAVSTAFGTNLVMIVPNRFNVAY